MTIAQMQVRRGTAAQWTAANPVLAQGEFGLETDTGRIKVGDGATAWNSITDEILFADLAQSMSNKTLDTAPGFDDNDLSLATTGFVNSMPRIVLLATAATTGIPDNVMTKVDLLGETNVAGTTWFETVTDSVITVKRTGFYDISAQCVFTGTAMQTAEVSVTKNGAAIYVLRALGWSGSAASTGFGGAPSGISVPLVANDTLQMNVWANGTGTATTVHDANNVSRLCVVYRGS
jgi:hypothetical protein